ncbi:Part of AAA domain-containing protein [Cribrihabitans marinus]|uniref:Part of AAA domain-containing protein n=1 Tax=Cribrihabitans marinus TaxID=1227549 RepID=A0A1H7E1S8_9RHOB|nr:UvrD-helicase domain-containing protein [Cribrihabitans marinus]GGH41752.1 hypothetical protein GCM10010973_38870 [Cribrihabitans marinus]SEK07654.1 Part of AAA domain-containing protein [Cribrihabitans marinus]
MKAAEYLETLNENQRAAVEFGVAGELPSPPLLVIAGAGSGKTSTLAHRVAHLLVNGAECYNSANRHKRTPSWSDENQDGRWRAFTREELLARDKASLDLFWLRDASMTDLESLPEPDVLAEEIMENLRSALANFEAASLT